MSTHIIHNNKIHVIRMMLDNQKTAFEAAFGGLRLVQAPGLSPVKSIANRNVLSSAGVDISGTVEVAGIESASPWVIIQDLSQSTPTASLSYQAMCRFSILMFTFSLFFFNLPAAHAAVTIKSTVNGSLANGLVGYWDFEEGKGQIAYDKSGNSGDGTLTNMNSQSWIQGATSTQGVITGDALRFENSGNPYVSIGTKSKLNLSGEMTISAWAKFAGNGGSTRTIAGDGASAGGSCQYELAIDNSNPAKFTFTWGSVSGSCQTAATSVTTLVKNTWYHVVATRSGSSGAWKANIYVNGNREGGTTTSTNPVAQASLSIGRRGASNSQYWFGAIDEVRIYNRVLSQNEITRLYRLQQPKFTPKPNTSSLTNGLVGYWDFEEGKGQIAYDKSGKGNDGVIWGATSSSPWVSGATSTQGAITGGALVFDGANTVVNLGTHLNQGGEVTISAWFKTNTVASGAKPIISNVFGSSSDYGCEINRGTAGRLNMLWALNTYAVGATPLVVNTWYHAVCVRSGSSGAWIARTYLNGKLDGTQATATNPNAGNNQRSSIGARGDGAGASSFFNGSIDEVRIYNRALSAAEVTRLYRLQQPKFTPKPNTSSLANGLVGYWDFEEGKGDMVYDKSGHGNNGKLTRIANYPAWVAGATSTQGNITGSALSFNGTFSTSNSAIDIGTTNLAQKGEVTVSAWFNTKTTASGARQIVSYGNGNAAGDYGIQINATAGKVSTGWDNNLLLTGKITLIANTWYHVVAVRSGSSGSWLAKIYLNGVLDNVAQTATNPNGSSAAVLNIGKCCNSGGSATNFFLGSIDEVRIYNRALSAAEVTRLYRMGK